jgi:hypothetical protein
MIKRWSDLITLLWLTVRSIDLLAWLIGLMFNIPTQLVRRKVRRRKGLLIRQWLEIGCSREKKLRPLLFPTFFFVWSIFSDRWTIHVTSLWGPHIPGSLEGYCIDRVATRYLMSNNRLPEGMFSYLRREMSLFNKCFNLQLPKKVRACS